jgi:hypothetical protein
MATCRRALLLCALVAGCTGKVDEHARVIVPGAGPGAGPGSTTANGVAGNADVKAADADMRMRDSALFDLSLKYFPGQEASGAAPRLFRLTRTQLDNTTKALLPGSYMDALAGVMPRDPLQTNYEYATNLSWNDANFTPYTSWIGALAMRVGESPTSVIDCSAQGGSESCLRAQSRAFITRAFRGITNEAQLTHFADFFVKSAGEVGAPAATADLVDVTLSSPSYVFREEIQTGADHRMLPPQLLQAVTYTLADMPPQALGLEPDNAAALVGTDDALRGTVDQVLATPQARAKLLHFFTAWLEVREPDEFTISTSVFPEFTPELAAALVSSTQAWLEQQLQGAAPALKDITQGSRAFTSEPLASFYAAGPDQRLGIFTEPAVIASHSGPTTTRLIKRGVFFTRKVMCLPLGNPPPGVDTTLPTTPATTERQKIEAKTKNQPCAGCHTYINPFGFMQENYDALGRWRTTDQGQPIDASASLEFLDEGLPNTTTPLEALRALTGSGRFKQCFMR